MKKIILFIALIVVGLVLNAQSVGDVTTIDYGDYSLRFSVTSIEPAECMFDRIDGTNSTITIPSTVMIDGIEYKVTSIGSNAIYEDIYIKEIVIPNTVTYIAESAISASSLSYLAPSIILCK